jgi:hypothetical protein
MKASSHVFLGPRVTETGAYRPSGCRRIGLFLRLLACYLSESFNPLFYVSLQVDARQCLS